MAVAAALEDKLKLDCLIDSCVGLGLFVALNEVFRTGSGGLCNLLELPATGRRGLGLQGALTNGALNGVMLPSDALSSLR